MKIASLVLAFISFCFAQQTPPTEVPVENEPHHHLVFENEYVRVFKVEVPPHQETLVHRHKRDYVVVTIGDAEVTNAIVGKEPKKWDFKDGDVTFLEASGEKSFAHKAVNESARFFENYTIELKQPRQYYERDSKTDERRIRFFSGYAVTEGLFRPFSNSGGPYGGSGDYFGLCGETAATGALVIALDRIQFGTFDKATNKQDNTAKVLEDGATWWVKPQMRFCATGKSARGSRAVIIQRAE